MIAMREYFVRFDIRSAFAAFVRPFALLLALLALAGCAAQLSPAFDPATYKTITDLNVKTETLFAALSGGATASSFGTYRETYAEILGGFAAARMATASRAVPAMNPQLAKIAQLDKICADNPADCINPTPRHIDKIIVLLTAMRDTHQRRGLSADLVGGFKRQYELEMNPILVFEAALNR